MEIVKASQNDFRNLAEFARYTYVESYGQEMDPTALNRHLKVNMSDEKFKEVLLVDDVYLAFGSGHLIGFAQVGMVAPEYAKYLQEFDRNGCEVRRLYVNPEMQRQGIGSVLFIAAAKKRTQTMYLTTWESNLDAQKFYAKHGFKKIGQIPEYGTEGQLNGYEYLMVRKP